MKGFVPSEIGHVVQLVAPVDITGGVTAQRFNLKKYQHVSILVLIGASTAAFSKIIVKQCQDAAGTGAMQIPFTLYAQELGGAANDVISARTPVSVAGYTPSANDGIFYVIEIDACELSDGFNWVELDLTNGTNSVMAAAIAILSGGRLNEAQSPTVTS